VQQIHRSVAEGVAAGGDFKSIKDCFHSLPKKKLGIFNSVVDAEGSPDSVSLAEDLEVAIRLASRMMTHPDSLSFFHGILTAGARYERDVAEGKPELEHYEFRATPSLTADQKQETIKFLEDFGRHVWITERGDLEAHGITHEERVREYHEGSEAERLLWFDVEDVVTDEFTAKVSIDRELVAWTRGWRDPSSTMTVSQVQQATFCLAATLSHEVVHAICLKLYPWNMFGRNLEAKEPFFEDECLAEAGMAWGNYLFAGNSEYEGNESGIVVSSWPTIYAMPEITFVNARDRELLEDESWLVVPEQVSEFFKESFWNSPAAAKTGSMRLVKGGEA